MSIFYGKRLLWAGFSCSMGFLITANYAAYAGKRCGDSSSPKQSLMIPDEYYASSAPVVGSLRAAKFYKACIIHDDCYSTLGKKKMDCDRQFLDELNAECSVAYHTWATKAAKAECKVAARAYYEAVCSWGNAAYNSAQKKAAEAATAPTVSVGALKFYKNNDDGVGQFADPKTIGGGGWQQLTKVFSGGDGIIYAVNPSGQLLFYRDTTQNGTGDVGNPRIIGGGGWQQFSHVFSGGDGVIYAVNPAGQLLFYRDKNRDGTGNVGDPKVIGSGGWQGFIHLFSGGDGVIYAVNSAGQLLFYRDKNRDGTGDVGDPKVIGNGGWQELSQVFSNGNGVIYAINPAGQLLFYRDAARNGTGNVGNPKIVGGGGWEQYHKVFSGGNGIIYAITK